MKRFLSILLVALLLISTLLCGCTGGNVTTSGSSSASSPEESSSVAGTLTICVDMLNTPVNSPLESDLLSRVPGLSNMNVQFEILSTEEEERNTAIARIRTEMMAGGGPGCFYLPLPQKRRGM